MEESQSRHYIQKYIPILLVFLLSFVWFFILTYNFNFFWEDSSLFARHEASIKDPETYSIKGLSVSFLKIITDPSEIYVVRYFGRPLNDFYITVVGSLFGVDLINQRAVKAALAGLLFIFIYLFINKFGKKEEVIFSYHKYSLTSRGIFCFLSLFYFLIVPEVWLMLLYLHDGFVLMLTVEVLALYLFFFYYNNDAITNKVFLSILFFFIVFLTHVATLARHFGRINFVLFFLFLLATDKKKLLTWRYGVLVAVLFFISFPVLGIMSGKTVDDALGIAGHTGESGITGALFLGLGFLKEVHLSFLSHGFFLLILLILFAAFHRYGYVKSKQISPISSSDDEHVDFLKKLALFTLLWFLLAAFTFYVARGLVFERTSFLRREFMMFIIPQTIFIIAYAQFVYKKYFSARKFMQYIIYFFILLAILSNVQRLNEWRGGWGAYFLGYDTVRQYVDDHAEHSLLIVPFDHGSPIYFLSTNQHAMVADMTNTSLLKQYAQNYTRVFITRQYELTFNDSSVVNIANLTVVDNSPYGWVKKAIGKYYKQPMYVYELK